MAWVEMLADHRYTPADRRTSVKYLAGKSYTVRKAWADAMVALGVAKAIKTPRRALPVAERFNGADPAAFDHDGVGGPGGSRAASGE